MTEILTKCPNCRVALPSADLSAGWCDECGQKIPLFVYEELHLEAPDEKISCHVDHAPPPPASVPLEPDVDRPEGWQFILIGLAVIGVGLVILFSLI